MRTKPWLGLIAAGPLSPSLFRIASLSLYLGPVVSSSLRVASRLANRLKAGDGAALDQLAQAELIFITGPESGFQELLSLAISAEINWSGRSVILLDFRHDSSDLAPLRERGASTGTLDTLDAFPDLRFVADADDDARRRLQRFAAASGTSIFYITPGRKQFFSAGSAFTGTLFSPLVAATVECLKKSGLTQSESLLIAERNTQQTLRSWIKSGRKGWAGTLPDRDVLAVHRQFQALQAENDLLSNYFATTARLALLLFGEDPAWLNALDAQSPAAPSEHLALPRRTEATDDTRLQRLAAAGRMAANLAHDWNNLLTLLAAQTGEIAGALPPDHPAQPLTAALNSSLAHAADTPRRLLNWLRDVPGLQESVPINDAIRQALPLVQLALGRAVQCVIDLDENLPLVLLDRPLFQNALLNLASNAANAMGGRGVFTIRTLLKNGQIRLTLEDTGHGMDDETCQRVFEPFYSTSTQGGAGLGMDTVQSFLNTHGASVEIDTAPGEGCRFTITFPPPS
ncbi:MAG TPA: ATP-binding protein [Bryobacteraceae bacterium]|nr:ATP-binding protein [Bryobacteraceae bacterium]